MAGASAANDTEAHSLAKTHSRAQSHHSAHLHKHQPTANAAVIEYGYPRGHLGHLTEEENKAFQEFKAYLQEKGIYKAGPPPSHDDPTLL